MITNDKNTMFDLMMKSVYNCDLCPRMCNRRKVLSNLNGNINTKVVFIAEAPGRLGAECTGIPLCGDETGNNFETLLSSIGWSREDVFITNALLCNPQDDDGNNATPTKEEICNCSYYLDMVLELIHPEVIVTLGAKALEALNNIENHNYSLKENVAKLVDWHGIKIFPMYHMSPRAAIHRSIIQQRTDFIALSHEVSPQNGLKKEKKQKSRGIDVSTQTTLASMVDYIVYSLRMVSFFKLTKILYLIDYYYLKENKRTISNCIYLRMQEGPWIPYLKNIVQMNKNIQSSYIKGKPFLTYLFDECYSEFENEEKSFIDEKLNELRDYSDAEIKTRVYLTPPMKYILREERTGRAMGKVPVLYKNLTVQELDRTKS